MLQPVILAQDLRRNWLKLLRICVTKPWLIRAFSRDGDAEVSGEHVSRLPKQQLLQCVVLASGAQARASQGRDRAGRTRRQGVVPADRSNWKWAPAAKFEEKRNENQSVGANHWVRL